MKRSTLLAAALTLLPWACAGENPTSAALDRAFDLEVGESTRVEGTDVVVLFEGVPDDSRCPPDVQCISAGDATVTLRLTGGGKDATTHALHTDTDPREAVHGAYVVGLIGLRLPSGKARNAPAVGYVATLLVRGE